MDILDIFAANLKRYREKAGYSQEYFAEICDLHRTYISALECKRRSISLRNIQKIAIAIGVEPYLLLMKEDKNGDKNDKD